jgi:tRNA dimethylallyltransferase
VKASSAEAARDGRPGVLAITGPTGSGKSRIAQELAESHPGRVVLIAMDSLQVYRGMDIGTAKPNSLERERARYLGLDVVNPDQEFSIQAWLEMIEPEIERELAQGNLPVLVGGTGYYLRALSEGTHLGPKSDPQVRASLHARLESEGLEGLRRELAAASPLDASRAGLNPRRVLRALEVLHLTGQPPAAQPWRQPRVRVRKLVLRADRAALARRLRERVLEQLEQGLLDEVAGLVSRYGRGIAPLQAIAYREPARFLAGEIEHEAMIEETWARNRAYARRQVTWLRTEPGVTWHHQDALAAAAEDWVAQS